MATVVPANNPRANLVARTFYMYSHKYTVTRWIHSGTETSEYFTEDTPASFNTDQLPWPRFWTRHDQISKWRNDREWSGCYSRKEKEFFVWFLWVSCFICTLKGRQVGWDHLSALSEKLPHTEIIQQVRRDHMCDSKHLWISIQLVWTITTQECSTWTVFTLRCHCGTCVVSGCVSCFVGCVEVKLLFVKHPFLCVLHLLPYWFLQSP